MSSPVPWRRPDSETRIAPSQLACVERRFGDQPRGQKRTPSVPSGDVAAGDVRRKCFMPEGGLVVKHRPTGTSPVGGGTTVTAEAAMLPGSAAVGGDQLG